MGVKAEVIVANREEAQEVLESYFPSESWFGGMYRILALDTLSELYEILGGLRDDVLFLEPLAETDCEWVFELPAALVAVLASLDADNIPRISAAWAATDGFKRCPGRELRLVVAAEALDLLIVVSKNARDSRKQMLLWMCL